jgi:hypothetical protein
VDRSNAIKTIRFDSLRPFMRDIRVISPTEFEGLPYIIANEELRLNSTYSDQTYARGLDARVGEEYIVARVMSIYDSIGDPAETRRVEPKPGWPVVQNVWDHSKSIHDPTLPWNERPKNPIGYEMVEVSRVRVAQTGEISVLDVIRDRTEVKPGDYILPVNNMGYDEVFYPRAMDSTPEGLKILATSGQRGGVGIYQIVAINGGSRQGVQPGHVFSAYRAGEMAVDETGFRQGSFAKAAKVQLPAVYDGLVMVFRTFEDISYGMVMKGDRVVLAFDELRHPDRTEM